MVVFSSTAQEDYSEHTLVCLTNLGDLHLFNVPGLRPQVGLGRVSPCFSLKILATSSAQSS